MEGTIGVIAGFVLAGFLYWNATRSPAAKLAAEEKAEREQKIVCPHCLERGGVRTSMHKQKQGISGGKATGAILTGGVSLLATGLARKGWVTKLGCTNCGVRWEVAA